MDVERKLATVRIISDLAPIPEADVIETAHIDGWKCVVKKGEFKVGDLCVFFEIDSILPVLPQYEFLRKSSYRQFTDGTEGFRLKSSKMRGQLSQGLALPISILPSPANVGDDVTALLQIKKYEPTIPSVISGQARGNFPSFMPRSDQERIQNLYSKRFKKSTIEFGPNLDDVETFRIPFNLLHADTEFEVTIKLDGSSQTVYIKDGYLGVCSRNLDTKEIEGNAMWRVTKDQKLHESIKNHFDATGEEIALQGEIMGPGIQGNKENLTTAKFFVYDIWSITRQEYFTHFERTDFVNLHNIAHVPVFKSAFKVFKECGSVAEILALSDGPSLNNTLREGLVFKSLDGKVSFKVISNQFLLKYE